MHNFSKKGNITFSCSFQYEPKATKQGKGDCFVCNLLFYSFNIRTVSCNKEQHRKNNFNLGTFSDMYLLYLLSHLPNN